MTSNNFDINYNDYSSNQFGSNDYNQSYEYLSIHLRNPDSLSGKLHDYSISNFSFNERYHLLPTHVDPNVDFNFMPPKNEGNHNLSPSYLHSSAGALGNVAGDAIYDMVVNKSNNLNTRDVARQVYNAGVWESVQAGSVYGMAYAFGSEVIVPAKIGWAAIDASSIYRHELDYLAKHDILTKANIQKAEYNAALIAGAGAFSAELKFSSSLGKAAGIMATNATTSFSSRAIRDSYEYVPHKQGWRESFFVFRTNYVKYPIVFVLGSVHDGIDGAIEWSGDKIENSYNWLTTSRKQSPANHVKLKINRNPKGNVCKIPKSGGKGPVCPINKKPETAVCYLDSNGNIVDSSTFEQNISSSSDRSLMMAGRSTQKRDVEPSSCKLGDASSFERAPKSSDSNSCKVKDIAVRNSGDNSCKLNDATSLDRTPDSSEANSCPINNGFSISFQDSGDLVEYDVPIDSSDSTSKKISKFLSGQDIDTARVMINSINSTNNVLEGANIIKHLKKMDDFHKTKTLIGYALKNFQSSTLDSEAMGIIRTYGNLIMKDKITPQDFALLLASFPQTPLPIADFLRFGFAAIDGNHKQIVSSYINLSLSILALSNPAFAVGQVLMTTVSLLKELFTKTSVYEIQGIQALYTDKVRIRGFFKKYHKCSLDNEFFGIHVQASGKHRHEIKRQCEESFKQQAKYKVYQVIGTVHEMLDPDFQMPEDRFGKMVWNRFVKTMFNKWLQVNEKYMSKKESDRLKDKFFETEDQKQFKAYLSSHGYESSWFSNHASENPVQFYNSVCAELQGCNFMEGFYKFFGLFGCNPKPVPKFPLEIMKAGPVVVRNEDVEIPTEHVKPKKVKWYKKIFRRRKHKKVSNTKELIDIVKEIKRKNEPRDDQKMFEDLKKDRKKKDNDELDRFNDSERALLKGLIGPYSRAELFREVNYELLDKHISVGYIFDVTAQSVFSNIGCSIAYADHEIKMIRFRPLTYVCHKSEQLATSVVQNYVTNSISEHIMTIPTILFDESIITDEMLKYLGPATNIGVGLGVSSIYGIARGRPLDRVASDALNTGLNTSLTTGIMNLTKETVLMTGLDAVSKDFATGILIRYGILVPEYLVSAIVVSATISVVQRLSGIVHEKIHKALTLPDKKKAAFHEMTIQHRTYDIFDDMKANDSFFTDYTDPFFANNQNQSGFGFNQNQSGFGFNQDQSGFGFNQNQSGFDNMFMNPMQQSVTV